MSVGLRPRSALRPRWPVGRQAAAGLDRRLERCREWTCRRGVDPLVYWPSRAILQPFFRLYLSMRRHGMDNVPARGPLILAANHRSFLDPFMIGCLTRRRIHYMAKRELFVHPVVAWVLSRLGAFPVDRRGMDEAAMETARAVLARGGCVVIFPEGTRTRPGPLGRPRRGVGRLALETGAAIVPVSVHGTDDVRNGWRVRPRRVRLRCGRPLHFAAAPSGRPSPAACSAVTQRVWSAVALQWQWSGGEQG